MKGKTPSGPPRSLRQPLEGTCPEQALGCDIPVLNISNKPGLDPSGLRFPDRLCEFGFRADDRIKLLPDLAGDGPGPTCPDLAHVDKVFPFLLPEVERGDAGRVFHKTDDREFTLLHAIALSQASLRSER
jgi:hypothetical protein